MKAHTFEWSPERITLLGRIRRKRRYGLGVDTALL